MDRYCTVGLLATCAIVGCSAETPSGPPPPEPASIIIAGEHIVTMDTATAGADAVVIRGEEIIAVGSFADALDYRSDETRMIELGERALVPGFIDAHGHMPFVARLIEIVDLAPPPVGTVETIDDIVVAVRNFIDTTNPEPGTWIFGFGYDDSLLEEGRHPNRDDIDRASTDHPIVLTHVSGHLLAANSLALALSDVNAETADPPGGVIRRRPGSREPDGVMEETAMAPFSRNALMQTDDVHLEQLIREAIDLYAGYGITTIQDGGATLADVAVMRAAALRQPFKADVAAYPRANNFDDETLAGIQLERDYVGGFRIAGVKFGLDGSPQGRTAYLSEPYTEGPPGADDDYRAYPIYAAEDFNPRIAEMIERGIPALVHANGDGAIDMLLDGVALAGENAPLPDHRTVVIHGQLMRRDQLDRTKRLGLVPSYYSAHPFFWGDWHRISFGEERAAYISPAADTAALGIPFTIHNDSPVVPPDIMRLLWIAVNRKTRSGYVLGPDQRLTAEQALHAVTLGAAYQYFEEARKGSITVGKQADLVILGENPLLVDPDTLKDIRVIETFARGQSVFVRE